MSNIPKLAMIVAMADNRMIGGDGQLMWHLPVDWAHFKRHTLGKTLIMGRVTFESLGKPLRDRAHVVISSRADDNQQTEQVKWVKSIADAIITAQQLEMQKNQPQDEIMILGGGTIYHAMLPLAERLYITRVHMTIDGDTLFPDWLAEDGAQTWRMTEQAHATDTNGITGQQTDLTFETWNRA